jgi:DNA helicase IV
VLGEELAREQAHLDRAYERLAELQADAAHLAAHELREFASTPASLVERDVREAHGTSRLRGLRVDDGLCFGRIDRVDGDVFHIGRVGVSEVDLTPLVVDWRAPVAEPFYRATPGNPLGLIRRRHLLTRGRRVIGVDDEPLQLVDHDDPSRDRDLVLVGEAALLDAVTQRRTGRMRDIVATIQAEQDEIIRAPLAGVLVVQGGPGTGKTAVALHRAAYLLYRYRFPLEEQGVLVVGPNAVFLRYIERVLPSLGEAQCQLTTVDHLYEGSGRAARHDRAEVARIKGDARMASVVAAAVRSRERALARPADVGVGAFRLRVGRKTSAAIVDAVRELPGTHNERRPIVERLLLRRLTAAYVGAAERAERTGLAGSAGERPKSDELGDLLADSMDYRRVLERMWPVLTPERLLDDLFGRDALLDEATRDVLSEEEAAILRRERESAWTVDDLPLLDEARALLGVVARRQRPRDHDAEAERAKYFTARITDDMFEAGTLSSADPDMVRVVKSHLMDRATVDDEPEPPPLFPKFGHVVVDEAQELSAMQWRMLARRAASMSMTVVGDLHQASGDAASSSWGDVTAAIGASHAGVTQLTVNYRTPSEVMALADRLLEGEHSSEARCVRDAGVDPMIQRIERADIGDRVAELTRREVAAVDGGKVAVIAPDELVADLASAIGVRLEDALDGEVTVLSPEGAKGLEFDSVIVVEPQRFSTRSLYVALTRTTTRLTLLHTEDLPAALTATV